MRRVRNQLTEHDGGDSQELADLTRTLGGEERNARRGREDSGKARDVERE